MTRVATSVDLRKNPRARLKLPARIRWRGPLGMRLESTFTVDVSRGGLLVQRLEDCDVQSRVWVAFPFDKSSTAPPQPETPARVVRVQDAPGGGYRVALQLDVPERVPARPRGRERRSSARIPFALPIFVRAAGSPWPEESMTQDISRAGARFETANIYAAGDSVLAKIPWGDWERAGEMTARIVRVEAAPILPGPAPRSNPTAGSSGILSTVSIRWDSPPKK